MNTFYLFVAALFESNSQKPPALCHSQTMTQTKDGHAKNMVAFFQHLPRRGTDLLMAVCGHTTRLNSVTFNAGLGSIGEQYGPDP